MFDATWIESVLYQPPVILGRQLRPMSPLHVLILQSIASPFLSPIDVAPPYDELIVAVHVCSLSWVTRRKALPDEREMKLLRRWGRKNRKASIPDATEAMLQHVRESWQIPERWSKPGQDGPSKANGAFHLAIIGMSRLGMTQQQAWDCPIARLICYREAYAEQETGKSDLMTAEEKRGIEVLKQKEAQGNG